MNSQEEQFSAALLFSFFGLFEIQSRKFTLEDHIAKNPLKDPCQRNCYLTRLLRVIIDQSKNVVGAFVALVWEHFPPVLDSQAFLIPFKA